MFHCINCSKVHEDDSSAEKLFQSGYTLVNDIKIPLGICKMEDNKKKSHHMYIKKARSILQSAR
jgi:hypothetical protein